MRLSGSGLGALVRVSCTICGVRTPRANTSKMVLKTMGCFFMVGSRFSVGGPCVLFSILLDRNLYRLPRRKE
jgi:hypothetical protein